VYGAWKFDATVDFALNRGPVEALIDFETVGKGGLGPSQIFGQQLPRLVAVSIGGLFSHDYEVRLLGFTDAHQHLRHQVRIETLFVAFNENAAVGADGESTSHFFRGLIASDTNGDDLALIGNIFDDGNRLFDGNLTKGIEFVPHIVSVDALSVRSQSHRCV